MADNDNNRRDRTQGVGLLGAITGAGVVLSREQREDINDNLQDISSKMTTANSITDMLVQEQINMTEMLRAVGDNIVFEMHRLQEINEGQLTKAASDRLQSFRETVNLQKEETQSTAALLQSQEAERKFAEQESRDEDVQNITPTDGGEESSGIIDKVKSAGSGLLDMSSGVVGIFSRIIKTLSIILLPFFIGIVTQFLPEIKQILSTVFGFLKRTMNMIWSGIQWLFNWLNNVGFFTFIGDLFRDMMSGFRTMWGWVTDLFTWLNESGFFSAIGNMISDWFDAFTSVLANVRDVIFGVFDIIVGALTFDGETIARGASAIWDGVIGIFTTITDHLLSFIADMGNNVLELLGLNTLFDSMKEMFGNILGNVADFLPDWLLSREDLGLSPNPEDAEISNMEPENLTADELDRRTREFIERRDERQQRQQEQQPNLMNNQQVSNQQVNNSVYTGRNKPATPASRSAEDFATF